MRDYIAQMQKLAKRIPNLQDGTLLWVILRGPRPQIKANIIQMRWEINSVTDILEQAKLAELAGLGKDDDSSDAAQMKHLMEKNPIEPKRSTATYGPPGKDVRFVGADSFPDTRTSSSTESVISRFVSR